MKNYFKFFVLITALLIACSSCGGNAPDTSLSEINTEATQNITTEAFSESTSSAVTTESISLPITEKNEDFSSSYIPEYSGKAYIPLNNNTPQFKDEEMTTRAFEDYESLDYLGRCGTAFACLGKETMPTEERGEIGMVKPSGWHTVKYDCVDGKYLYNRCHLIGFQLSGENANDENLITGTRFMNTEGMLPFENMVADYIKETNNHVMYRVTPVFENENLICKGVQMEACSVEDNGEGIFFNVFCYNVQPSIKIDYETGESSLIAKLTEAPSETSDNASSEAYILNTNSKKFHTPGCSSVNRMAEKNKKEFKGKRSDLIADGYSPCSNCNP